MMFEAAFALLLYLYLVESMVLLGLEANTKNASLRTTKIRKDGRWAGPRFYTR